MPFHHCCVCLQTSKLYFRANMAAQQAEVQGQTFVGLSSLYVLEKILEEEKPEPSGSQAIHRAVNRTPEG